MHLSLQTSYEYEHIYGYFFNNLSIKGKIILIQ